MFRKTETIKFSDFMAGENRAPKKPAQKLTAIKSAGAALPLALMGQHAFAAGNNVSVVGHPAVLVASHTTQETIRHAFDPLVSMITQISFPVAAVMITGGALMIMIGMKDRGYTALFQAAVGFILVQMSPLLLNLLFSVGGAV